MMAGIREARPEDATAISRVVCLCYEAFRETDDWPSGVVAAVKVRRGSSACIGELIRNEDVFVADDGDEVRGMISIRENEVTKLFVDPGFQRRGVGRSLFLHAEAFIRGRGFGRMFLGAAVRTAIPFYERMGMRVAEKRVIDCGPCVGMTLTILEKERDARRGIRVREKGNYT